MREGWNETTNLTDKSGYGDVLKEYQEKLQAFQKSMDDPWIMKWEYE